jgi:hypothetical protein
MAACSKGRHLKNMEANMKCPNLLKREMLRCKTIDESYKPSQFQLHEYCKTLRHKICPFFLGYQKKQAGLSLEANQAVL